MQRVYVKVFDHLGVWHKFPLELAYHGLLGTAVNSGCLPQVASPLTPAFAQ
jgi:hypothetical protein